MSIQTFQSGESKPGNGPSFEQGMCKNYYEQQRIAKEFGDQLCSGATESSRSVTHLVDQSASHRADKEDLHGLEKDKAFSRIYQVFGTH